MLAYVCYREGSIVEAGLLKVIREIDYNIS
jgi:hypothetical protein